VNIIEDLRPSPTDPDPEWSVRTFRSIIRRRPKRSNRRRVALVGLGLCLTTSAGVAAAATSGLIDFNDGMPTPKIIASQERLDALADKITATDTRSQIATIEISPETGQLFVHIRGDVPAAMSEAIRSVPGGVHVEIVAASYSMADMQAGIRRIGSATKDGAAHPYELAIPVPDGAGLKIGVSQLTWDEVGRQTLIAEYQIAAEMPVEVSVTEVHPLGGNS